ncbi:MAG: zinc-binding dehydrogenase [Anaerolineales bacterium]
MKAIRFNLTIPRYVAGKIFAKTYPPLLWSGLSCTSMTNVPDPELPGPDWVKIETKLAGICGTDTGTISLHTSTYYEPFNSSTFTLGHEQVGTIVEVGPEVQGWQVGDRVVVEPDLWCAPRGFAEEDWCEFCKRGEHNRCTNVTRGSLAPGWGIGGCQDTGGSWSRLFTAHQSQLYRVPDSISDENAMMVEPFACGLHAALKHMPAGDQTVLILGAGTIGLMQLASLRAAGCESHIIVAARYPFQAEAAERLGADEVLIGGDVYEQIAERTGGQVYTPMIGKRVLVGGVDQTFECVGNDSALDDALRLTKAGGKVVVMGMPGLAKGVDWAVIFDNELTVVGSYIYDHTEQWEGRTCSTFEIALEMMARGDLDIGWMVSRRYPLGDFDRALREIHNKRNHPIIKAVFSF